MPNCYICGDQAGAACILCGQSICGGHTITYHMSNICVQCAQKRRKRMRFASVFGILFFIAAGFGIILYIRSLRDNFPI